MLLREHPWNVRRVGHRHLHDHQNLLDLHLLSHAWQASGPEAGSALPALPNPFLIDPSLQDDTTPEEVLLRLERQVHLLQLQALSRRLSQRGQLDEHSWKAGRECGARRWSLERDRPPLGPADRRTLLVALLHSPLAGLHKTEAFLVRRALSSEVSIELRNCPHCEVWSDERFLPDIPRELKDAHCDQQFHWVRGYFHYLNPRVTPSLIRTAKRCVVSW